MYSYHFEPLTTNFSVVAEQLSNYTRFKKIERRNHYAIIRNEADVFAKDLSEKLSHLKQRLISEGMSFEIGRNEFMRIMRLAADMNFMYDTTFLFQHVDDELLRLLFGDELSSYNSFKQCTSVEFLHQKLQNNALYIEQLDVDLEKVKKIFMRNISFFFNKPSLSQYLTTSEFIFQLFSLVYYFERAKNEWVSLKPTLKPNGWQNLCLKGILDIALKMVNINCFSEGAYDVHNIVGQRTCFKQPELLGRNIFNIGIFTGTNGTDEYSNLYALDLGFSEEPQLHVNYSPLYRPDGNVELINELTIPNLLEFVMEISRLASEFE
jgi:hypothetical protein